MLKRSWEDLGQFLNPQRVLVIYGPRRVGKTTLIANFLKTTILKYRLDSGDDIEIQNILSSQSIDKIKRYAEGFELIVVDEAQKVNKIGTGLKILVDYVPGIKIIATGSSSFDLSNKIGEPLTGRKTTLTLFPISQLELKSQFNSFDLESNLEEYLVYGSYPEILETADFPGKQTKLRELVNSYLYRDILEMEKLKGSKVLLDLLRLLAFQVGSEVSLRELGQKLELDSKTVSRYLDLLEKAFVIINLRGLSRNLREEVTRTSKYYFYDNGVRNALISNFNGLETRDDISKLWENFLFIERLKYQNLNSMAVNNYFWRTWSQNEIDFVEERDGNYFAFEFKYSQSKKRVPPLEFSNAYPKAKFSEINKSNYWEFVT
jgi:predicted AAA+ superfamily ATPase